MSDTQDTIVTAKGLSPYVTAANIKSVDYPLDKLNKVVWGCIDNSGLEIDTADRADRRAGKDAFILYEIDLDELDDVDITNKLTPYDKRVYIAVASIFNAGLDTMSVTMIHKAMGNTGQPDARQVANIHNSLTKMNAAHIYVNNEAEAKSYHGYKHFVYDSSLLPFERISAIINGKTTDAAIHLYREPPLMTFARERKQITTLPIALLKSPLSKTDANLILEDYFLAEISHMKNKSTFPRKMRFSTIFDRCGIKTPMQRSRVYKKIKALLDYYKQQDYILGYDEEKDGIFLKVALNKT